ncbi:MBL fold metallo-hydrolase [Halobellus rufus]|uniref:MBL fold metallo-hydrolase n=1 Tax=Halobellus rufus TaxID=1448860 RepID=UPI0006793B9C|nr:MBL fold metallo-hydrolase [Halobellus rufus]
MDVTRIQLENTVFEGQNNVYLLEGAVTTLIDVGIAMADVRSDLLDGLAAAGVELADLDQILLTHWHPDHSGLAGELQAESGATVRVHEDDAPLVAGDEAATEALTQLRERRFDEWGIPAGKRTELADVQANFAGVAGDPSDVQTLAAGDSVPAGDGELGVWHLPGHAAGHVAFTYETEGEELPLPEGDADEPGESEPRSVAFVGDVILPEYTPNVGGADLRVERPLERYVDSLDRLIARDLDFAWPGHRDPIAEPSERARVIRSHHVERTRRVVDVLREHGPADAWTVSAHLFGELEDIHILHGPGEAFAHLDHLEHAGVVDRDGTAARGDAGQRGSVAYRLLDRDPDVSALFPKTKY